MARNKDDENMTTEEVTDLIPKGRSIMQGGKLYTNGDEKKFAVVAKTMHPDDLQLLANRGEIIGFGTEFVETDDLDREAVHPIEYAESRKAEAKARVATAGPVKPGTAAHLQAGRARDETAGTDSARTAPAVPSGQAAPDANEAAGEHTSSGEGAGTKAVAPKGKSKKA